MLPVTETLPRIYLLLSLHMLGDYVIQTDFLAKHKAHSWWYLLAHCLTYTLPFAFVFGIDWRCAVLLATHLVTDEAKNRGRITETVDQALHVATLSVYFL